MTLTSVKVKDYMSANLVTFTPEMEILGAINQLLRNGISGAPVVDARGNLVGILSEKDCLKVALHAGYYEFLGGRVEEYMSPRVEVIDAEASIIDVAKRFIEQEFRRYPVVMENRLVGQISRRDVLKALEFLW